MSQHFFTFSFTHRQLAGTLPRRERNKDVLCKRWILREYLMINFKLMSHLYLTYVGHGWPYRWTKWPYTRATDGPIDGQNGPIDHDIVDKMALYAGHGWPYRFFENIPKTYCFCLPYELQ